MTIAPAIPCPARHQAPLDRLALRLGLALVAWGNRPVERREVTREDARLQRAADGILAERDRLKAAQGYRLF
jgi:hypothetical protein